jgi:hypothetical protein
MGGGIFIEASFSRIKSNAMNRCVVIFLFEPKKSINNPIFPEEAKGKSWWLPFVHI